MPQALSQIGWRDSRRCGDQDGRTGASKVMAGTTGADPTRTRLGQLWQVPVFLAGVLAVVGVWLARPLWHVTDAQLLERDLKAARRELSQPIPDWPRAAELAEEALNRAGSDPKSAGLANFLLGSALVGQAGQAPPQEATAIWENARAHLEEAAKLGVPEADAIRLLYVLGKARYHTGADVQEVINCLARSIEQGAEDPFEGYRMLVDSYLHLEPANLQAALETNKKQLDLPKIGEPLLAPARLLRGKLLLQLKQPEEARKVLARIGRETPALFAEARSLRARSYQQDKLYKEAAKLWLAILKDQPPPQGDELGRIWFSLGECYSELRRPAEAVEAWQKAKEGEAAQAAAFRLGQWKLAQQAPEQAMELFEQALGRIHSPGDYHNSLLDLKAARQILEEACKSLTLRGDHAGSLKLADLYQELAPPEGAQALIAQAADEWAKHLMERNDPTAYKVYREAAAAYGKAADLAANPADQAHWLWLSADRYLRGKDEGEAIVVLERFLQIEVSAERRGEAWLALAIIRQSLEQEEGALQAFYKCIECPGPYAFRARYRLAEIHIKQGKLDDAEAELEQNLRFMDMQTNPDPEAQQQSLFLLANLYYQRKNYRKAALRYQELLDRYPNDPRTIKVREKLADSYRRMAELENNKQNAFPNVNQYRQYMQAAEVNFAKLVDDLTGLEGIGKMTPEDEQIKQRAEFMLAQCKFDLEKYEDAARLYDILADRYRYRVDGLTALRQLWRCSWALRQPPEKIRDVLARIRTNLDLMDENLFKGQPEGNSRQDWLKWLTEAEKK